MALLLGVDTGGTYTDAVVLDEATNTVVGKAKALTSRPDLSIGVGEAIDAAIDRAEVAPSAIGMVSLSTTLATNALVEGQGGKVALIFIGFGAADLERGGLSEALAGDPVLLIPGGHDHAGRPVAPLDTAALSEHLAVLDPGVTGVAIAARFATRNPEHEVAVREIVRAATGLPVTCSHELSAGLGGPKRALTAVLNARLIGLIDGLIDACDAHLARLGIEARLMVVRGDGALVSAELAREKPIETILSGPAASVAGAAWLTGHKDAFVSDIGGTTTDICLLQNGRPKIDPDGARVGGFRTMVEAVAMRTHGLGGDSEVHLADGLEGGLRLGPRRVMPVSLIAMRHPDLVHDVLDRALAADGPVLDGAQFVVPLWADNVPGGLDTREARVADRLGSGPRRLGEVVTSRIEAPALGRLVSRGHVAVTGVTPSDAAHVLGLTESWDAEAAFKALTLQARKRDAAGQRLAPDAAALAAAIIAQLQAQTCTCLLQSAFAEDGARWAGLDPALLAAHALTTAGLDGHKGRISVDLSLGLPVIGLGASAAAYYGAVGTRLRTTMDVPEHADVANAIGAVVGQIALRLDGSVTTSGPGVFVAHLDTGPQTHPSPEAAMEAVETALRLAVTAKAETTGVAAPRITADRDIRTAEIEGSRMFIGAEISVTAQGRPRIAD